MKNKEQLSILKMIDEALSFSTKITTLPIQKTVLRKKTISTKLSFEIENIRLPTHLTIEKLD